MDEILAAARAVFCEKGYEQAAVAEIAARMGVVEGTVFKYFPTKRELLLKVLEHWYEEMFGDNARDLAAVQGARARLRLLIWRHLRSVRDYPQLCRLMFREVRPAQGYYGSALHEKNRRYTQFLLDVIRDGVKAGEFRADLPPALLRDLVYGGIEHHAWGYMAHSVAGDDRNTTRPASRRAGRGALDIDAIADQLTTVLCEGITTTDLRQEMQRLVQIASRVEHKLAGRRIRP